MPVEWSADSTKKFVRIRLDARVEESACLALVRDVITVTCLEGGHAVLIDARGLTAFPEYHSALHIAQEMAAYPTPLRNRIAFVAPADGMLFGKSRQFVSMLVALGLDAEIFTDEPAALRVLERPFTATSTRLPDSTSGWMCFM